MLIRIIYSFLFLFIMQNAYSALNFPNLDPTAFTIFGFSVKWYGIFYLIGLGGAMLLNAWLLKADHKNSSSYNASLTASQFNDIAISCFLFAVVGGRLGYVLFYDLSKYLEHPIEIFYLHQGGMSFHGGLIGAIAGLYLLTRKNKNFWLVADLGSTVIPFALGVGRLANFINDELWGRVTNVAWAIKFPSGGYLPRHPSQLYEAILEGLVLLVILIIVRKQRKDLPGLLSGIFIAGYGISRFIIEFYREPDQQLGFIIGSFTQGQLLSAPMIILGLVIIFTSKYRAGKHLELVQNSTTTNK